MALRLHSLAAIFLGRSSLHGLTKHNESTRKNWTPAPDAEPSLEGNYNNEADQTFLVPWQWS